MAYRDAPSSATDGVTVPRVGITSPGSFNDSDPSLGLELTLRFFADLESLGYDSAGIRQRHLERGSSSALTFLAAATQRTSTISLETNVIPLGYEVPFRLAEDFLTISALSNGRLTVGISSSAPHGDLLESLNRPDASPDTDPYELIERFLKALESRPLAAENLKTPYGTVHTPAIRPIDPQLTNDVWLGAGSDRSARWAAKRGLGLLLGNITDSADGAGFEHSQRARIDGYVREFTGALGPRVAVERVILPLDSATDEQRRRYRSFAEGRFERTLHAHGERRTLIQPDLIGTSTEIAEALRADPVFDGRTELRLSLPYAFDYADYVQIVTDVRDHVLPVLGWTPSDGRRKIA